MVGWKRRFAFLRIGEGWKDDSLLVIASRCGSGSRLTATYMPLFVGLGCSVLTAALPEISALWGPGVHKAVYLIPRRRSVYLIKCLSTFVCEFLSSAFLPFVLAQLDHGPRLFSPLVTYYYLKVAICNLADCGGSFGGCFFVIGSPPKCLR